MSLGSMFKDMVNTLKSQQTKYPTIDTLYSSFKPTDAMFNMEQDRAAFNKGGKVKTKEEMPKCKPN
jgi:hypothetical protein